MGRYYEDGKGLSQDYSEAVKWFKLAVEQGHAGIFVSQSQSLNFEDAMNHLGLCYEVQSRLLSF